MNNIQNIAKLCQCATILKELQSLTNCPICLEPAEDSVRLECSHFLCANCFQGILNEKPVRCPICRKELNRRRRARENKIINAIGKFTTKAEKSIKDVFSNIKTVEVSRITSCTLLLDALEYKEPALINFCTNLANKSNDEQPSTSSFNKCKETSEKEDKDEQPSTSVLNKNITTKQQHKQLKNIHIKEPDPFDKLLGSHNEKRLQVKKTYSRKNIDINKSHIGAIDNKVLEFEDSSTKVRIVEWLHDTQNMFDRMTQTQNFVDNNIETVSPDYFDMVSVSQLHKNKRLGNMAHKNIKKLHINFESNNCSKEGSFVRAKSFSDIPKIETSPIAAQRHSLENHNTCDNYNIEESNTEEKDTLPKKAILNILENQCLDSIDREMLEQTESNSNKVQQTVSKEEIESLQKPATKTNKSLETTGWNRMKEIKRTIGKGKKGPKKLNITLQPTQCSKVSIDCTAANKNKETKPLETKNSDPQSLNCLQIDHNSDSECEQASKALTVSKQSRNLELLQNSGDFYSRNSSTRIGKRRYNLKNLTGCLNNSTTENEECNTVESEDVTEDNLNVKARKKLSQQSKSKSTESNVSSNKQGNSSDKVCLLKINNQLGDSTKDSLISHVNTLRNLSPKIKKLTETPEEKNEPSTSEQVGATSQDQVLIAKQNIFDVDNHERGYVNDDSIASTQISHNHTIQNPTTCDDGLDDVYGCPTQKLNQSYCSNNIKNEIINSYVKNANGIINSLEVMVNKYISTFRNSHPPPKSTLSLPSKTEVAASPSMSMFLNLIPELDEVYTSIDQLKEIISKIDTSINNCNTDNSTDAARNSCITNNVDAHTQTDPCKDVIIKCCKSIQTEVKLNDKKELRMQTKPQSQCSFYSCDSFTQTFTSTCNKEIQTDAVSQAGFMISVSEAFKTQELVEKEIQTSVLECSKCRNSCFVAKIDENIKIKKSSGSLEQSGTKEIKGSHGRYSLTEFFDEINFDTQEALKTHALKDKGKSDAGVSIKNISPQTEVGKNDNIRCENIENLLINENNIQIDVSENETSTNSPYKRQAAVEEKNLFAEEKLNISQAKNNKTSQESVLLCTFNDDSNKNMNLNISASKSVNRRLNFSGASNDINSSKKTYKRIRTNSTEEEQYPKRQCNRFIRDDISVVFETENIESTLPNDDNFQLSEEGDNVNYDEYLDRALNKKYANKSDNSSNKNIMNGISGRMKSSEKITSCNDLDIVEPIPKRSRTQEVLDACKVLINEATKKHFNTSPKCGQDSSVPVQIPEEKTRENVVLSPLNVIDLQGTKAVKNVKTVQLTGDLIFDEHNMSKIERDIEQHEKINTEFSDIIANTENEEKWLDRLKMPVSKNLKLDTAGQVNLPNDKKDKFSETMFCGSAKMEESKTVNISAEVLDEFLNDMNVTMRELDDEADAEVERISLSSATLANQPFPRKREKEANKDDEENKDNASQISDEIFSDVDIVETTPEKTKQSENRNSSKLKENKNDDISISQEIAAIQNIPFSLDLTLPPPPGFQDTEDKKNSEVIILSDVTIKSNPTKTSSLTPDFINLSALMDKNESNKNNTAFYSQTLASQKILSLSPIPVPNKRQLNVFEISKQSKSSPLSITARPKPQRQALSITTSTPKQKSILPFIRQVKKSEEKVMEHSVESSPLKSKPCIACSRLNKKQVIAISSLTNKKLAIYSNTFGPDVTHLIVTVNDRNCLQDHTMKFVSAVAAGIWILNFDWIQECLAKNRIVDEEPFEVLDVSSVPGPRVSRLRLSPPLLRGYKIHCAGPFSSTSKEEIEEVVRTLGGAVITNMQDLLNKDGLLGLIITEAKATQDFDVYEEWLENFRVVTVDIEWLSRSVGQYHLLSLRPFALCSDDSLCDLGYPEELIVNEQYSFITPSA